MMEENGNHYFGDRCSTEDVPTSCWFSWTLGSESISFVIGHLAFGFILDNAL
jgi:hypothetical protein